MMNIDGRQIASAVHDVLQKSIVILPHPPVLAIVIVGSNPVIESFVRIKKKFGESLGVSILEFRFGGEITADALKKEVATLSARDDLDGIVIQLPLPETIDAQAILDVVPVERDVDVLSRSAMLAFVCGEAKIFPPVASAIQEILERHNVDVIGKEVLILGHGRLVGKPVAILLQHNNAHVTVIDKPVSDLATHIFESDIVITGVGIPGIITPAMLRSDTVLIDAGTSESGGKIVGDIDPACAEKVRLFTPVPGGVGPVAVAMLFKNLLILTRLHSVNDPH